MSYIEWLWCHSADLDPFSLSVPEKLSKFGYALVLNRLEAGKTQTAELCIHDCQLQYENPNIVIVCPEHLLKSWYSALLWDLGIEFKYFGVFEQSLDLFSDIIANYCLVTVEQLARDGENSILSKAKGMNLVWDLMIVDLPFGDSKNDLGVYAKSIKTKTKKLLINAFASKEYGEKCEKLTELVKSLLYYREQANEASYYPVDAAAGLDGPIAAGRNIAGDYSVRTLNYTIDMTVTSRSKRVDDAKSGIPLYNYGGNVFEEYSLDERRIYLRDEYSEKQIKILAAIDKKLGVFLEEIDMLLEYPDNRVVVYCTAQSTANYLNKVLKARYGVKMSCVYDANVTESEYIANELAVLPNDEPRIIISDDNSGSKFLNVRQVTHIINYEYPDNPIVLEQRYSRSGRKAGKPVFYIFCDSDYRFDGRMLRKAVLSGLDSAFHRQIPDKCLLFDAEDIDKHLCALILDLKFICDYTAEVGSSFEVIERFRIEYNEPDASTALKTNNIAKNRLKKLVNMFDLNYILSQKEINQNELFSEIAHKVAGMRGKRIYLDERSVLHAVNNDWDYGAVPDFPEEDKFIRGAKKAALFADGLTGGSADYVLIKKETETLSDSMKFSVLVSLWKFYRYDKKIEKPFREFIGLYNRGVI